MGDAIHGTKNICIGIAAWGVTAERDALIPKKIEDIGGTFHYHMGSNLVQRDSVFLDYNHSHFLLVDDGSEGSFNRELTFRTKFEEFVMTYGCDSNGKNQFKLL